MSYFKFLYQLYLFIKAFARILVWTNVLFQEENHFHFLLQLYSLNPFEKNIIQIVEGAAEEDPDRVQFISIETGTNICWGD